jgi:hypothetical protein
MDDIFVILIAVVWLIVIVGLPTGYIAWKISHDEDEDLRYRLLSGLKGWFIGLGVAFLLYIFLPGFIIQGRSDSTAYREQLPVIQFFLILILPPACGGIGFLAVAFMGERGRFNDEKVRSGDEYNTIVPGALGDDYNNAPRLTGK